MAEPEKEAEAAEETVPEPKEASPPVAPFTVVQPMMSRNTRTFLILVAAIVLILVAMILRSSFIMLQSDMYDLTGEERQDRKDALDIIGLVEDIFIALGIAVFLIGLLYGSIDNPEVGDMVRMGMIIGIAIVLGLLIADGIW